MKIAVFANWGKKFCGLLIDYWQAEGHDVRYELGYNPALHEWSDVCFIDACDNNAQVASRQRFPNSKLVIRLIDIECIARGQRVLMSDFTWKPIENIQIGDSVLSFQETSSKPRKRRKFKIATVTATRNVGKREVVRISGNGNDILTTPDHKFLSKKPNKRSEWRSPDEISAKKECYYTIKAGMVDSISEYEIGYVRGLIDADGHIRESRVTIQQKDVNILTDVECILRKHGIESVIQHSRETGLNGKKVLRNYLYTNGGKEASAKFSLIFHYRSSDDFKRGYIAGFIVGDGTVNLHCHSIYFWQSKKRPKNEANIHRLNRFFIDLDIPYSMRSRVISSPLGDCLMFEFQISQRGCFELPILYGGYKKDDYYKLLECLTTQCLNKTEFAVEAVGKHEVYDITTTTGTFICENFVVHNCWAGQPGGVTWENVDVAVFGAKHIEELVRGYVNFPANVTVAHIPFGVDLSRWSFRERDGTGKNIAFVAHQWSAKGLPLLLQAMMMMPSYKLHVLGTKSNEKWLHRYVEHIITTQGLDVTFTNSVKSVDEWLDDKDYLIVTSVKESYSYVCAEAAAKGIKPLVHNWWGASGVWPDEWIWTTLQELLTMVGSDWYDSKEYRSFIERHYSLDLMMKRLNTTIGEV